MRFTHVFIAAAVFYAAVAGADISSPGGGGDGWDNGNAGDIYGAEFILTGRDIVGRLRLLSGLSVPGLDPEALNGVIHGTKLRSDDHVFLGADEVDAANYPEQNLIKLNRTRWHEYRAPDQTKRRLTLVLHEYLYIMKIDDTGFFVSEKLITLMRVDNYSPGHWWNPLNPANTISLQPVFNPSGCKLPLVSVDPAKTAESIDFETPAECAPEYRKVHIEKASFTSSPASGYRGNFHRFDIQVIDSTGRVLGAFTYEPQWGICLLPQDGSCQLSGTIQSGGLNFSFWFLRN